MFTHECCQTSSKVPLLVGLSVSIFSVKSVISLDRYYCPLKHTLPQLPETLSPKGEGYSCHGVQDASEAPRIHLWGCVRHSQEEFWGHEHGTAAESVWLLSWGPLVAKVKVEILVVFLVSRTSLPGFKSWWPLGPWWQCCRAETSWRNGPRASPSVLWPLASKWVNSSSPLRYCHTINRVSSLSISSRSFTIFG